MSGTRDRPASVGIGPHIVVFAGSVKLPGGSAAVSLKEVGSIVMATVAVVTLWLATVYDDTRYHSHIYISEPLEILLAEDPDVPQLCLPGHWVMFMSVQFDLKTQ